MRLIKTLLTAAAVLVAFVAGLYFYMARSSVADITALEKAAPAEAIVVLGARVYADKSVSGVLASRLDMAAMAYRAGKAPKIIASGDHGQAAYDEVEAMKQYLLQQGVPERDIFLDHAGFSTYDSIYRAQAIFGIKSALIVSQQLHLERALFIARQLGLTAQGLPAPTTGREAGWQSVREIGARLKAFFQAALLKPPPRFLGDKIPVSGDGRVTW